MPIIDHIGLPVRNYRKSKQFYLEVLKPLGYELIKEFGNIGGFGKEGKAEFWIEEGIPHNRFHVAFIAKDHKTVDAFYETALKAGGKDNGAPGPRPQYHENYYGAFILDLDGYNIEAVCHGI